MFDARLYPAKQVRPILGVEKRLQRPHPIDQEHEVTIVWHGAAGIYDVMPDIFGAKMHFQPVMHKIAETVADRGIMFGQ